MPQIKVDVGPRLGQDLTEWAKKVQGCEGKPSVRQHVLMLTRRLVDLRGRGPDVLRKMEVKDLLHELELTR